jgi:hypothetical protein
VLRYGRGEHTIERETHHRTGSSNGARVINKIFILFRYYASSMLESEPLWTPHSREVMLDVMQTRSMIQCRAKMKRMQCRTIIPREHHHICEQAVNSSLTLQSSVINADIDFTWWFSTMVFVWSKHSPARSSRWFKYATCARRLAISACNCFSSIAYVLVSSSHLCVCVPASISMTG